MDERKSSRALIIKDDKIFLFQFHFAMLQGNKTIWISPGGKVEKGESYEDCLEREIDEELGINIVCPDNHHYERKMVCTRLNGDEFLSVERYYVIYLEDDINFSYENWTQTEKNLTMDGRWWTSDEIENSDNKFFTDQLSELLRNIIQRNLPEKPYVI